MKHKHPGVNGEREPRRSHLQAFRKAAASVALLAGAASLGSGKSAEHTSEPELPRGSVVLASDTLSFSSPETPRVSTQEIAQSAAEYCKVADVTLPSNLSYEKIAKGLQTEVALPEEQYQALTERIDGSETIAEAQALMDAELATLGIDAKFDVPLRGAFRAVSDGKEEDLDSYKYGLKAFTDVLSLMPKEAFRRTKSVNFLNTSYLVNVEKKNMRYAGLYSDSHKEITLSTRGMDAFVIIHEIMHSLHSEACGNDSDEQLQEQYSEMKELYDKLHWFDDDTESGSRKIGFPRAYSRESDRELFADLAATFITRGGYIGKSSEEIESVQRLHKMVADRLQKALPGVDVDAYLQARDAYQVTYAGSLSPREIVEHHVSPFDATYAGFSHPERGYTIPAIVMRGKDGVPDQYIYAHIETTEYVTAVDVSLHYMSNLSEASKRELVATVHEYFDELPLNGTRDLTEVSSSILNGNLPDQFKLEVFKPRILQALEPTR